MVGVGGEVNLHATSGKVLVLDPVDRLSEVLFGLIMAMSFTGSIQAATAGRGEIRTLLVGALGCNLAWGLIDAVMYLLTDLLERNRTFTMLRALRAASGTARAQRIVAEALPPALARVLNTAELDSVQGWIERLPEPPTRARITLRELRGALGVFLLVSLSTFPLVVPFLLLEDPTTAVRTSHAVALVMLFGVGSAYGRNAGLKPLRCGLGMIALGVVLVAVTITLGG